MRSRWRSAAPGDNPLTRTFQATSRTRPGARSEAEAVTAAMNEIRKLLPRVGSYVWETDYFQPHWQEAFWGENYARLLAVKGKYDPDGLFFLHHGVGSEDWSADGFTRLN